MEFVGQQACIHEVEFMLFKARGFGAGEVCSMEALRPVAWMLGERPEGVMA